MSTGWENLKPAPIEFLHGKIMDYFHELRVEREGQENTCVIVSGSDISNIIAKAKTDTYKEYPGESLPRKIKP